MGIRVGVFGATGKMGQSVCAAVGADPDLDLVACVDPYGVGRTILGNEVQADPKVMADNGVQVAVDFTVLDAARTNLPWCALHGIHAVVGTTGFNDGDLDLYRSAFTSSNCLIAPNFAIGAVLMMRFAEMAAPYFQTAEIIELHHNTKADAPSGTAVRTAERMAAAGPHLADDPTKHEVYAGARGGVGPAGIHVHAVRMVGMFAHQEVIMGTNGQTLIIRHDTFDRDCYMPGVVLAIKRIPDHRGLTLGLEPLMGI
jgi:4-hydroxy-tetrahydrodipicolinate reductase